MRCPTLSILAAGAVGLSAASALAQESNVSDPTEADAQAAASVEEDEDRFEVRRGFYAVGDFGGYFSFGGRRFDTQTETFSDRSVSNFQPMVGVTVGFDLVSDETINFALGLRLATYYNASSSRATDEQVASLGTEAKVIAEDFGITQVGLSTKFGYMALDRLAINLVADGGLAIVDPDPGSVDGGTAFGVNFGGGLGLEFATQFPGFSIGLDVRFVGTLVSSRFIPGMSISAPLKYNF